VSQPKGAKVRKRLVAMAIMALLASPALAQQPPPEPPAAPQPQAAPPGQPSPEQSLRQDPNVARSQDPQPAAQGTRPPQSGMTDTQHVTLTQALEQVWNKVVDLQGNPVARPNPMAAALPPAKNPQAGMLPESPKP
jgi:hypothetical protein